MKVKKRQIEKCLEFLNCSQTEDVHDSRSIKLAQHNQIMCYNKINKKWSFLFFCNRIFFITGMMYKWFINTRFFFITRVMYKWFINTLEFGNLVFFLDSLPLQFFPLFLLYSDCFTLHIIYSFQHDQIMTFSLKISFNCICPAFPSIFCGSS